MTPIEKTTAIRDLLSANLPALLSSAGLSDFDEYRNKTPKKADDKELCVYIVSDSDNEETQDFTVLIQAQLYQSDQDQEYHSVIYPYLTENLTGDIVGDMQRQSIVGDIWPMEPGSGAAAFLFYEVSFFTDIDDCG